MKKYLLLASTLFFGISCIAQYDPQALSVLDKMSAKYKNIGAYEAVFTQEMINPNENIKGEKMSGTIIVKNDKYVLKIEGQEIYNNGKEVYNYSEELGEVTVSTFEPDQEEITLGNIYDLYKDGFKYVLLSEANGESVVELDPESKDKSYFKIRLIIGSDSSLKKFTIFERSGNKYIYTINKFTKKPEISDSYFTFDTASHSDVELIDFR